MKTGAEEGHAERRAFRPPEKGLGIPADALVPGFNDAGELLEGGVRPRLLLNGNLLIPKRAESEDGRLIGDGMIEVKPGTPEFELWIPFLSQPASRPDEETDPSS